MNALFFATFLCMGALASASWGHGVALWSPGHHGAAPIGHDGRVVDTPEVAHAKAAHFSAVAAATHGGHGVYGGLAHGYGVPSVYGAHGVYAHGLAPLSHDGVVVDTPEVAHAKIAHASAVARLSHGIAHGGPIYGGLAHGVYGAGYGVPAVYGAHGAWAHGAAPIGHDGRVVDTPEVAHAKAAHFSAVAAATHGAHGVYGAHAYGVPSVYGHGAWAHGGAPIGHDGRVVDTPEVAHAKAAHFAAKAAASHGAHHYGAHGLW